MSFKENIDSSGCPVHHHPEHPGYVERFRTLYAKLTESSHEDEEAEVDVNNEGDTEDNAVATAAPQLTLVTDTGDRAVPDMYNGDQSRDRRISLGNGPCGTLPRDRSSHNTETHIKHGSSLTNLKVTCKKKLQKKN